MDREVLLLNASEEVLNVIDWKKAVALLESGKAIKPYFFSKIYSQCESGFRCLGPPASD